MANKKRLIDANALKAKMRNTSRYFYIKYDIDEAPTVDAVEVVRCKDCKHNVANREHDPLDATDYTDIVCDYWMSDGNLPNDFCSYGERRTDNGK